MTPGVAGGRRKPCMLGAARTPPSSAAEPCSPSRLGWERGFPPAGSGRCRFPFLPLACWQISPCWEAEPRLWDVSRSWCEPGRRQRCFERGFDAGSACRAAGNARPGEAERACFVQTFGSTAGLGLSARNCAFCCLFFFSEVEENSVSVVCLFYASLF